MLARAHHQMRWTPEEDDALRRMFAGGAYLQDAARALSRSQEAVRTRANCLKVPVRSAPPVARARHSIRLG